MPWSGGVYTRTDGNFSGTTIWATEAAQASPIISSTQFDTHDNDLATGLNNCMTKDGTNKAAATISPGTDASFALGSSAARWTSIFLSSSAAFSNSTFASTITAGTLTANRAVTLPDAAGAIVLDTATQTLTNKSIAATQLTGQVTVAQGGTGLATLTTGNVLVGAGTSNVTLVAPGTAGNVLTSTGSSWASSSNSNVSSIGDATNGGLNFSASTGAVTANLKPGDLLTKGSPTTADSLMLMDAAASNAAKTATIPQIITGQAPTKATMQAGTDNTQAVTAAAMVNHPGIPKTYAIIPLATGPTTFSWPNAGSVVRSSAGNFVWTTGVTMLGSYVVQLTAVRAAGTGSQIHIVSTTATTVTYETTDGAATDTDLVVHGTIWGQLA